jgi:predicted nuclease of predicted toxin-antitoxin system
MVLKFYSNENFPIVMVNLLRAEKYDVLTSYEAGQANQGISDDLVLQYASTTGRILITENRQDFIDLHQTMSNHNGIIIFKHDRDYAGKIKAIIDFLNEENCGSLENRLLRVMKQNIKGIGQVFVVQEDGKN